MASARPESPKKYIAIGIGLAVAAIAVYLALPFVHQNTLQPNYQITDLLFSEPRQDTTQITDLQQARVANSSSFNYVAERSGDYSLVFSNTFSLVSDKQVSLSYSIDGDRTARTITVPAPSKVSIPIKTQSGQTIEGSFTISGGSGNDVDFFIMHKECSQTIISSFNLVNAGKGNGTAFVTMKADGQTIASNQYYLTSNQQVTKTMKATIADCDSHSYTMMVEKQTRT